MVSIILTNFFHFDTPGTKLNYAIVPHQHAYVLVLPSYENYTSTRNCRVVLHFFSASKTLINRRNI